MICHGAKDSLDFDFLLVIIIVIILTVDTGLQYIRELRDDNVSH